MKKEISEFRLSDRKSQIILGAVESYIENALPITSEKVQSNLFSSLSSATLRNELSSLEEMGYLKQLHTSSGRVPTTKAYRYYVDNLMQNQKFDPRVVDNIRDKFATRSNFLLETLDKVAKQIGEVIEYPVFVRTTGYEKLNIVAINIIPLITGQALFLIQTNEGIINNTIDLPEYILEEHCRDASKFLSTNLRNKQVTDVIENFDKYNNMFKNQIKYFNEMFTSLTSLLKMYVEKGTSSVARGSTKKLLENPELNNMTSAKKFLNIIENEKEIGRIIENIDENSNNDIVFSIGEENDSEEISDYSIVKTNYHLASGINASIGVVGPERMDYAKIASALKYITDELRKEKE